jgi:hypothetical protein
MKVEIGKKYKDGNGDVVEIIHMLDKPMNEYDKFVGIVTIKNGLQMIVSYDENGLFLSSNIHKGLMLVEEIVEESRRNLAFYKRSGEHWTFEEYNNIMKYVGDTLLHYDNWEENKYDNNLKFIFDDGRNKEFMYYWYENQEPNFKNCKQVAYEDIFGESSDNN